MKSTNRVFETDEFMSLALPLIKEGLIVPLRVSGGSMEPFLAGKRDTVYISAPSFPMKRGDIAFFKRENGKIIMHRICKIKNRKYYFIGDAQIEIEGPVDESQVFGVVKNVHRKGRLEKKNSPVSLFFKYIWIRIIPLRPAVLSLYRKIKGT